MGTFSIIKVQLGGYLLVYQKQLRPDLKNLHDVDKEIETELLNGVLFASDEVIKSMAEFVRSPNHSTYVKTAVAMRKDLWGKKTSVDETILGAIHKDTAETDQMNPARQSAAHE